MKNLLDKTILNKYKDSNGFIRLEKLPKFDKIFTNIKNLDNTCPINQSNYPWKYQNTNIYKSMVEEYVYKIFKNTYGIWIQLSRLYKNDLYYKFQSGNSDYRLNMLIYISKISFVQSQSSRYLKITYLDINGRLTYFLINDFDIPSVAIRFCEDEEIKIFNKLIAIGNPEPKYERFLLKEEYKNNYDLYVKDSEKYGYKILRKNTVEVSSGKDIQLDKEGYVYSGNSVEVKFINI